MDRAVCRMPAGGTGRPWGTGSAGHMSIALLLRVENEALADERIEGGLRQPGQRGTAHDVPDKQLVVAAYGRVLVVVDADRAFQPPVGRVQAVRVVAACHLEACPGELGGELGAGKYAHVAAGH